jgi:ATP-binding cassette subfamily C (CFTR/MRP) protein 2
MMFLGLSLSLLSLICFSPFLIFGFIPLVFFFIKIQKKYRPLAFSMRKKMSLKGGEFQSFLSERCEGISYFYIFSCEKKVWKELFQNYAKWVQYEVFFGILNRWFALRVGLLSVMVGGLIVLGMMLGVYLGFFKETIAGMMITLSLKFEESLIWFVRYLSTLESSLVPLWKIQGDMSLKEEDSYEDKKELKNISGHLIFKNLFVKYDDSSSYVLEDFSAECFPSQIHLLVGRTGSGKSTFVKALLRGVGIEKGQILLDGEDLANISTFSLRQKISYVPQEPLLFSWNLRKNIDFKGSSSDEDILRCISFLKLEKWFQKFPEGLDTFLKEGGSFLSLGEKQLICMIRALVQNCKMMVLDEPTSSLDMMTDHFLFEALEIISQSTTILLIAHRESTLLKPYPKIYFS